MKESLEEYVPEELNDVQKILVYKCRILADEVNSMIEIMNDCNSVDNRWAEIAKTDIQKGFMSLVKSITLKKESDEEV